MQRRIAASPYGLMEHDRLSNLGSRSLRERDIMALGRSSLVRRCRDAFGFSAAVFLGVMTSGIATSSRAEVRVEGTVAELRITTTDKDAIADVLAALKATFNIDYRAAIRLDATARSTYSGSLRQVIANVLDGYSY